MSPAGLGRIVWVTVPDPRGGNPKRRPAVVVSPPGLDGTVAVAAVTTQLGQSPFAQTVELPWSPAGHPDTGLKRPSEVVCSWVERISTALIGDAGGSVPDGPLAEILKKVDRLN